MIRMLIAAAALAASPALAEVKTATDAGFEVSTTVTIAASPEAVWMALRTPDKWWNPAHTWSGDAKNMWIDSQAGGCFCEKLPNKGSVQHGRIILNQPNEALLMTAALGPLQAEAVAGTLSWRLKPVEGGTEVTKAYVVGGYVRSGAAALAPVVDQVLAEQLGRLKAFLEQPPG